MTKWDNIVRSHRASSQLLAVAMFGAALLGCCAHHAPAMLHQRMAVISGKGTARDTADDALRRVFVEAAAITLDHGYRYFEIVGAPNAASNSSGRPSIRPGADVTIKLFGAGEVDPRAPGVWDAVAIGAGQMP